MAKKQMYSKKLGNGKQFVIDASALVVKNIRLETFGAKLLLRLPRPLGKVVELPAERFFIEYGDEGLAEERLRKLKPTGKERDDMLKVLKNMPKLKGK